ncbi:T9SS sorting signal type C domain-containing protein [Flavobacterium reichenbachii]|uniref:T9SS sorting signal type C domain-containing protein n=1 Tax=Flavobacterium reichenbachii TaxID=362418 RepID=UPI00068A6C1D|nr:T9SS sorting signal type C domain-containing protein [Flavobacterium reichenbachii]
MPLYSCTVNPLPQGSLSAVSPLCGSGAGQLTFTASIGTGPYTVVYKENGGADRTATGVVSGTAFAPFTTPVTASTTYTLVSVADANCIRNTGFTGGTATITVNPLPSVTLSAVTPVCTSAGAQNATLNYTNATAAPTTYSITWNASPSNSFAPVTDAALGASITIPVPGGTLPQTYTGALTVKNLNGCVSSPTNFTVTVNPLPSTPVPGAVVEPTCVTSTGSVALSGLIGSGTWTITQTGTASNTYTGTGTSYTVSNLTPGTYYFSIQQGTDCSSLLTTGVVINSVSINTWNGTAWSKGTPPVSTDAIVFSGNYTTSGDLSGCSLTVNSGVTVTVNSTHTLTITNSVSNGGGTLIFENSSSLYQTSNAVNTGNIIYKRIAMAVRRYDLTQWSSPVTRTPIYTLHDLSPNTLADKYYKYNSSAGAWVVNFNGTDEMLKGIGYSVRGPQYSDIDIPAPYYAEFEGVPNNGPVPVALGGADKWNLLGNPYPSAVYADQFIVDNQTNLYGALYFWTHNSKPVGNGGGGSSYVNDDYAIYNLAGSTTIGGLTGTGAGTPGNQDPPLGYIGAGQAFFVKSKTGSNASFTNSMRVPGNNSQFYKTENSSNKAEIEKHRIWLNLSNTEGAFKQLLIAYISGATNSWDNNYDAVTLDGNKYLDFYSIDAKRKLVIQGRAVPFDESDTVPLGYRSSIAGKFTISIDEVDGNLTVQPIYLEDKITGVLHDLKASDYTFTTAIGTFADRFVLKYFNAALGTDEFEDNKNKVLVSVKNKIIKLTSGSNTENLNQVVIFDVSGKVIYEKKKIGTTELEIINLKSGNEVLIVKTTLENGFTTSSKIVFY